MEKKRIRQAIGEWPDCPYCGVPFYYASGQVDHIQALSDGGSKNENNKILICADCNRSKNGLRLAYWLKLKHINPESIYFILKEQGKKIPNHMLEYLGYDN